MSYEDRTSFSLFEVMVQCTYEEFNRMQGELWSHPAFRRMRILRTQLDHVQVDLTPGSMLLLEDLSKSYVDAVQASESAALSIVSKFYSGF